MPRFLSSLALSAVVVVGCVGRSPAPERPSPGERDEERVRVAVLDTVAGRVATGRLVLSGRTWAPGDAVVGVIAERAGGQGEVSDDLFADFRARAATEVEVRAPAGTRAEIVVAPPAELALDAGEGAEAYWQRFRQVHAPATGWVRMTAAGFDEGRASAMVAAEYACGTLCGWGVLYRLSNGAAGWVVADETILWIR